MLDMEELYNNTIKKTQHLLESKGIAISLREIKNMSTINLSGFRNDGERLLQLELVEKYGEKLLNQSIGYHILYEAKIFATIGKAKEKIKKAPAKTKNYYIEDIDTNVKIQCNADGKCALCGRKLLFEDITIDHKIPLACGGADSVENLQICCLEDNQFKGSIMPDDFMERITRIFLYQMDQKEGKRLLWKIVHKILNKMI